MSRRKIVFAIFGLSALVSCGTPPRALEILASTAPPGASCLLSRGGQPLAAAEPTPAVAVVPIDPAPVLARCRRPGFEYAAALVPPAVRPSYPWLGYPITEYRSAIMLMMTPSWAGPPR